MKALVMHPFYINKILNGDVNYDARGYDTWIRGKVYLYDSKRKKLVGVITIVGTHPITVEEYYNWHGMKYNPLEIDNSHQCFGWDFVSPKLIEPIPVQKPKEKRVWFDV